jgi:hypothetical protein
MRKHGGSGIAQGTLNRGTHVRPSPVHGGSGAAKGQVHAPKPPVYGTHGGTSLPRVLKRNEMRIGARVMPFAGRPPRSPSHRAPWARAVPRQLASFHKIGDGRVVIPFAVGAVVARLVRSSWPRDLQSDPDRRRTAAPNRALAPSEPRSPGNGFRQASSLARLQTSGSARSRRWPWCSHSVTAPCSIKLPSARLAGCYWRGGWRAGAACVADWSRSRTLLESTSEPICARASLSAAQA